MHCRFIRGFRKVSFTRHEMVQVERRGKKLNPTIGFILFCLFSKSPKTGIDVKAGSEGRETFRRPLRESRAPPCGQPNLCLHLWSSSSGHLVSRCPLCISPTRCRLSMVPLFWLRLC